MQEYLSPSIIEFTNEQDGARVILQRFQENFSSNHAIGTHIIGKRQQTLRLKPGLAALSLDSRLRKQLETRGIPFKIDSKDY